MKLTIFYFAHFNPSAACVRYRGKYLLETLNKEKEVTYHFIYPEYSVKMMMNIIKMLFDLLFSSGEKIIINQKIYRETLYSYIILYLVKYAKLPSIYDIDDAYFVKHGDRVINQFIKHSTKVIVGSERLLQYAEDFSENIELIPSSVFKQHADSRTKPNEITIGFVGSLNYYLPLLKTKIFPALVKLNFPFRLVLIGLNREHLKDAISSYFAEHSHIDLSLPENIHWENETDVYARINEFTVGLAPLSESLIDECKSAFKLKQYFSLGIPVIGSNLGENVKHIRHQENGLVCHSIQEYFDAFNHIRQMEDLQYVQWSKQAKESLDGCYFQDYVNDYWKAIESCLPVHS